VAARGLSFFGRGVPRAGRQEFGSGLWLQVLVVWFVARVPIVELEDGSAWPLFSVRRTPDLALHSSAPQPRGRCLQYRRTGR
jgi:hypothetical protein